jgi:Phage terminase, small subunit
MARDRRSGSILAPVCRYLGKITHGALRHDGGGMAFPIIALERTPQGPCAHASAVQNLQCFEGSLKMPNARKSAALHVLHGTARPDRATRPAQDADRFGPLGAAPRWLLPAARTLWREIDKSLGRAGVLTALDRSQLTLYCQMVARWQEAETKAPYEPLPASYAATIAGIASKLGLNVADRAKLRLPEPMQRDPLAELLDDAG